MTAPSLSQVFPKEFDLPTPAEARSVTLVRHGQSEANRDSIWQGASSSPLTAEGVVQAGKAGQRLTRRHFDLVASSDLERCLDTASHAGFQPEVDVRWREGDLGNWEGLSFEKVWREHGDILQRVHNGENVRMGDTGESHEQVADRAWEALWSVLDRLDEGGSALVFTHGGLIAGLVRRLLGMGSGSRHLGVPANTGFCRLLCAGDKVSLETYNDVSHVGPLSPMVNSFKNRGATVMELVRHGLTAANLERRVQGRSDWGLNEMGRAQAERLGRWIGPVDQVYTSPLGRAQQTAEIVFGGQAVPVDGLMEIDMGDWEGEFWWDLADAGLLDEFRSGLDIPRGRVGETWHDLRNRASHTINGLAQDHSHGRVAVTSHGGTIRAYAASVVGIGFDQLKRLGPLGNTSVSQVVSHDNEVTLTAYNVAGHLEG